MLTNTSELQFIIDMLRSSNSVLTQCEQNWQRINELAKRHRLQLQLYSYLSQYPEITLTSFYAQLAKQSHDTQLRILATAGETMRIAKEFNTNNISYAVVKGIILNLHLYSKLESRPCRDIDIWVDLDCLKPAQQHLLKLGYIQLFPDYELNGFKEKYYLEHKHDILMVHPNKEILVELHFSLNSSGLNYFPFSRCKLHSVMLYNIPVKTLDDNYHLLYLMLHGSIHAYSRLRWLNDILLYLQSNKCDLTIVTQLAVELRISHIVVFSLILVKDMFNYQDNKINQTIAKADKQSIYLVKLCKQFIIADYELVDGAGSSFKMFLAYRWYLFNLAIRGQKIKMLVSDWYKIDKLFPYLNLPKHLSFIYYTIYPLWVGKYIISSIFQQITTRKNKQ